MTHCAISFTRSSRVQGKKAARIRAKLRSRVVTHNLPLEISLYLVRDAHRELYDTFLTDDCRVRI